jgi:prophage regulatory protein
MASHVTSLSGSTMGRNLRPVEAAERLGISTATFWRYARQQPDFPQLVKLSPRVTVVREAELAAWLERKASTPAAE